MIVFTIKLIKTRHRRSTKKLPMLSVKPLAPANCFPKLTVENPRTSTFYMLPKIHKVGNSGCPIVSACSCPTSNISAYLDSVMAPLVRQLPSYVKDTNHAIQILKSFTFSGPNRYLFTMDIKSNYTIIPNNDGLRALKYHLNLRPYRTHQQTRSFDWLNLFST